MPLFWLSLALAVAVVIGSIVYATSAGLKAFRGFRQLGRAASGDLERISESSAEIEQHLALAAASSDRLDESLARLRASRARLNVLTAALADVKASVDGVTSILPRK